MGTLDGGHSASGGKEIAYLIEPHKQPPVIEVGRGEGGMFAGDDLERSDLQTKQRMTIGRTERVAEALAGRTSRYSYVPNNFTC